MKEYTTKEIKLLKANKYTLNVTKNKIYFTAKFKEIFWCSYQAGVSPRKIIEDMGYDITMFRQKQIDSIVQRIKKQALSGNGFTEGENRSKRTPMKSPENLEEVRNSSIEHIQHELLYLRQEVEFLKKIIKADNLKRKS